MHDFGTTTSASPATAPGDSAAVKSRWQALYVLCAGVLMIVLDATIVNVALPSIQTDLGFTASGLAWVVNAYLIAFAGLLLLSGRLGDLVGRRTMVLAGLGVFTAGSLLCGLAQSAGMLVAARMLQGVGGAMTSAVVLGMIVTLFPDPREQAKAMGVYGFVASAGGAIGLLAGGVITEAIDWHWIFYVNVPIGIATAVAVVRLIDSDRGLGVRSGADVLGATLVTAGLMAGVYTLVAPVTESGWSSGRTLAWAAGTVALFAAFLVREAIARTPLMPLRLLTTRNLATANVLQVLTAAGMFGTFFLGSLYIQQVLGWGPLQIGLAFLPSTIVMSVLSLHGAGRIAARYGTRPPLIVGSALVCVGLLLFARVPVDGTYVLHVLPTMLLIGTGAGILFPALMTVAMADATPESAGLASGVVNTSGQAGGALGLAVLATIASGRTQEAIAAGASGPAALTSGFHLAFFVAAGCMAVAVAVTLTVPRRAETITLPSQPGELAADLPSYEQV